jgi:DNA-binding NarL/FixJ family response regulator
LRWAAWRNNEAVLAHDGAGSGALRTGPARMSGNWEDALSSTVLIADDHPLFRQALALALATAVPGARVIEAGTLAAAAKASAETPDLALITLDLKMPGAVGYSGIALLHAERPTVPILVVSAADHANAAEEARAFGAVGFLRKDAELAQIEAAIRTAIAGTPAEAAPSSSETQVERVRGTVAGLTPMQLKVLLAVLAGKLNKQIAYDLGMSEATVKAHMTAIMRKLDVQNRTQAALAARSLGLDLA